MENRISDFRIFSVFRSYALFFVEEQLPSIRFRLTDALLHGLAKIFGVEGTSIGIPVAIAVEYEKYGSVPEPFC